MGLSGAAANLHVTTPAITKSIANLEEELGLELVDRTGYRAVLNAYGKQLVQHARIIAAEVNDAHRNLQLMKSQSRNLVRVNAAPAVLPRLLPEAIFRLTSQFPDASVSFEGHLVGHAKHKLDGLANGDYDFLINVIESASDLSNFQYTVLVNMQLKLLAPLGHPVTQLNNPTLRQLRGYSWLFPASKEGLPIETMRRMFADSNTPPPEVLLHLPTREMAFSLLKRGDYLALMPYHERLYERDTEEFIFIDSDQIEHSWPLYLLQRRSSIANEATQALIDQLKEIVSE